MNKSVCSNPWCKSPYFYEGDLPPGYCNKCGTSKSYEWETKTYNEPRYDGQEYIGKLNIKEIKNDR